MTTEYTPETSRVMAAAIDGALITVPEFTRWLKQVRAEAWDEAIKWYAENIACPRTCGDCSRCEKDYTYNPYKEQS